MDTQAKHNKKSKQPLVKSLWVYGGGVLLSTQIVTEAVPAVFAYHEALGLFSLVAIVVGTLRCMDWLYSGGEWLLKASAKSRNPS